MASTIDISQLPVGASLRAPIYTDSQVKLYGAGLKVTEDVIAALQKRGVYQVRIDSSDQARVNAFKPQGILVKVDGDRNPGAIDYSSERAAQVDEQIERSVQPEVPVCDSPFAAEVQRHGAVPFDRQLENELADNHEVAVEQLTGILNECTRGDSAATAELPKHAAETTKQLKQDIDAFVCLSVNPMDGNYPSRHSQHTTKLALAIATNMQLDEANLMELSVGCMIHDLGMLAVRPELVNAKRKLDEEEFVEVAKHCYHTFDLLKEAADLIGSGARSVAYQMHERCDGSGYPRKRDKASLHYLSRIAMVADAYTALVSPRPHRKGMMPYAAIETILQGVREGKYDPTVVRALLKTTGLFPIGSFIGIGEEYVGRVIRANPDLFDRPVVEIWKRRRLTAIPSVVDLSAEATMKITRPLPRLQS